VNAEAETKSRAWVWPVAVVAVLALHIALWLAVVAIAGRDPSFSVEPGYYEKSVRWDETAAQLRMNRALGWSVEIETEAQAGALGDRRFVCRILDRAQRPIEGARVDLITFHHARAAERAETGLVEEGPGLYVGHPRMARPGLWECRLTVRRGGETFTHVDVHQVGSVAWRP